MIKIFNRGSNIGKLMILIGVIVAIPILVIPFYPSDIQFLSAFLIPSSLSIIIGYIVCYRHNTDNSNLPFKLNLQKGSLTVLFAWLYGFLLGAIPFVIADQLTFVQALFEAVSGFTTTGLSALDVTKAAHIFLFHRSFMQFCGGLGFVMVMILFIQGKQSMNLFSAEGHPDKLLPNLKRTARIICYMYCSFLVIGVIAYKLVGMPIFDGICHAMCSLSTGGFSTKLMSIGEYNSFGIELVTIALMIIGTLNFGVLLLFVKGQFKKVINVSEVKFMLILFAIFIPLTGLSLSNGLGIDIWEGLRKAMFDIVSALSTSGYASMSYERWPSFAIFVLILMMLIGGGIGSTAGGLKLTRVFLIFKIALYHLKKRLHPSRTVETPYYIKASGKSEIDSNLIGDTAAFVGSYLIIYAIGVLALCAASNCSITAAMFEFASALGTVGLSFGITNPTTGNIPLIIEMIGMMLGRLEIFIVIIGFHSGFNIIKTKIVSIIKR
ncbi:MAG: potassium transporter TrkG [Erysipelotrichaceae bacterium]